MLPPYIQHNFSQLGKVSKLNTLHAFLHINAHKINTHAKQLTKSSATKIILIEQMFHFIPN